MLNVRRILLLVSCVTGILTLALPVPVRAQPSEQTQTTEAEPGQAEEPPQGEGEAAAKSDRLYDQGAYLSPYEGAETGVPFATSGAPLAADDERLRPELRNREEQTTSVGDVLIWIPRVVFYPVYLVTEYLVRWPLGVLTRALERYHVIQWVDELTGWDDGNARIFPVLRISSGFTPAFGFGIIWDNMIWEDNDWGLTFDFNAGDNLTFEIATRQQFFDDLFSLQLAFQNELRNDFVFHGIGAGTEQADQARFFREKTMGYLRWDLGRTSIGIGARGQFELSTFQFDCTTNVREGERNICGPDNQSGTSDDAFTLGGDGLKYFRSGYDLGRFKGRIFYDSREPRPAPGDGIRIELLGRYGTGVGLASENIEFVRYGAKAGVFWDIWERRVLSLAGYIEFADQIEGKDIPFAELITLGGVEAMRGFDLARFHGRSAFVGSLRYQYPVWSFFDGYLVAEAGNAFGPRLEDFDVSLLHGSLAIGFTTVDSHYNSFDLLFALGTTPFGRDFEIQSARIAIGTNWGL